MRYVFSTIAVFLFVISYQLSFSQERGSEKVQGAFGLKLGQKFEIEDAIDWEQSDGDHYWFEPENPYNDFVFYSVARTPITGVVAMITGYSAKMTKNQCARKERTLRSIFYSKYPYAYDIKDNNYNTVTHYGRDPSFVKVACEGFVEYRLVADYYDLNLNRILKDERMKLNLEAANKDGL